MRTIDPAASSGVGEDSMYCEFVDDEDFVELYDLQTDPWQMHNLAAVPPSRRSRTMQARIDEYAAQLDRHRSCHGIDCWASRTAG